MVVAFTSLEDFLRNRSAELLDHISRTVVQFSTLPKSLQSSATIGAFRSTILQASLASKVGGDPVALVQKVAEAVASTGTGALQLSHYTFGYSGSNVTADEVSSIMGALHIADPWGEMSDLAARCGFGGFPLRQAYETLQRNRNNAAHDVRASIQPSDLTSFSNDALAIAMSFDLLASRAARLLNEGDVNFLSGKTKLQASIGLRFINLTGGKFSEKKEGSGRAVKVSDNIDVAWKLAISRAVSSREAVVRRNAMGVPVDWRSTDVQ
ncbi:hypothetical protein [Amycolatopsis sp. NPDC021455]|uniref:hypothetical protein n=1 Tax=Amycolatopsis sp. NPDC021455 TaxID=3154901 RepID=UPI00340A2653